jgi:hypothetical protein
MEKQLNAEIEAVGGATTWDLLRETFTITEYRRRFVVMSLSRLFGQQSRANAITQYSPTIFGYLGIQGEASRFLVTGLYAMVKLTSVLLFSIFVIDFIGRRGSLMVGIFMQMINLAFLGAYLDATNGMSVAEIAASPSATTAIYFYPIAWSIAWFSIPSLVSSEVFPMRIRSLNVSILMAFHRAFYFGCSRAMLLIRDKGCRLVSCPHKLGLSYSYTRSENPNDISTLTTLILLGYLLFDNSLHTKRS